MKLSRIAFSNQIRLRLSVYLCTANKSAKVAYRSLLLIILLLIKLLIIL